MKRNNVKILFAMITAILMLVTTYAASAEQSVKEPIKSNLTTMSSITLDCGMLEIKGDPHGSHEYYATATSHEDVDVGFGCDVKLVADYYVLGLGDRDTQYLKISCGSYEKEISIINDDNVAHTPSTDGELSITVPMQTYHTYNFELKVTWLDNWESEEIDGGPKIANGHISTKKQPTLSVSKTWLRDSAIPEPKGTGDVEVGFHVENLGGGDIEWEIDVIDKIEDRDSEWHISSTGNSGLKDTTNNGKGHYVKITWTLPKKSSGTQYNGEIKVKTTNLDVEQDIRIDIQFWSRFGTGKYFNVLPSKLNIILQDCCPHLFSLLQRLTVI
jgi:hypothetical protein